MATSDSNAGASKLAGGERTVHEAHRLDGRRHLLAAHLGAAAEDELEVVLTDRQLGARQRDVVVAELALAHGQGLDGLAVQVRRHALGAVRAQAQAQGVVTSLVDGEVEA
ncbi:MAG: hypothetical protein IPG81_14640 [Sandaracinaceae bacterium]|nr:hypothetical protein [Sandaracinaceae bacterium]